MVAATYLLGTVVYHLRNVLLLIFVAGFVALVLDPFVVQLQDWGLRRRGLSVGIVVFIGAALFMTLAAAFGYPLSNGLAHLSRQLPTYVSEAKQGKGVIGNLVRQLHLQKWINDNSPKLQQLGSNLAKPAFTVGKGAAVVIGQLLAVLTLVVLLLLEGPRLSAGLLNIMEPDRAEWCKRVGIEIRRSVVGYVLGDLLTSLIAGVVVGITMWLLGLPFPLLWAVWVALVDFLPQVGGALAGIPTIVFALLHSLTDGIVLAVVFLVYQQLENHVLNPAIMSKTVRTSPLLIFLSVLIGGYIGAWIGGAFGAFIGALLAVPTAASLQILVRELWQLTATEIDTGPTDESSA